VNALRHIQRRGRIHNDLSSVIPQVERSLPSSLARLYREREG
jgi:hypothetical protein